MSIKNVVIGTEPKTRKSRVQKVKPEASLNKSDLSYLKNESLEFFLGKNLDNGTDPLDDLLSGKKILWKKRWLMWKTNHNKHGKIMSDKEAFESGPNVSDDFFGRAYRESHYIVRNKKTQIVEFDDVNFYKFCDFLNGLK